jgi:hypothetical protein
MQAFSHTGHGLNRGKLHPCFTYPGLTENFYQSASIIGVGEGRSNLTKGT